MAGNRCFQTIRTYPIHLHLTYFLLLFTKTTNATSFEKAHMNKLFYSFIILQKERDPRDCRVHSAMKKSLFGKEDVPITQRINGRWLPFFHSLTSNS